MSAGLPPGQRATTDFRRFGLPLFAKRWPGISQRPMLELSGDVDAPFEVSLEELDVLPRHEQQSDFHCVTTWTRRDLRWSGYRLRDFWERFVAGQAQPDQQARYLVFRGLDGCRAALVLEDALVEDVLLADRLDGEALSTEHGAPIRVVAPAHYGYKSVKHLCAIEVRRDPPRGLDTLLHHPRGRVALEERGRLLPGRVWRWVDRAALPLTRWYYRRAGRSRRRGTKRGL